MQDYNTIIGVIQMRQNECSFSVIQARYHIGSGTAQRILNRFVASGFTLDQLKEMEPSNVEALIYPPENRQRKDIPLPDFQYYYDRIHTKGSKVNIAPPKEGSPQLIILSMFSSSVSLPIYRQTHLR